MRAKATMLAAFAVWACGGMATAEPNLTRYVGTRHFRYESAELAPGGTKVPHGLPAEEFAILAGDLARVELSLGESLHHAGEKIESSYFVEDGFISALTMLSEGQPLEIGLIGAEGVAGVSVILGATNSYSETLVADGWIGETRTTWAGQHGRAPCIAVSGAWDECMD